MGFELKMIPQQEMSQEQKLAHKQELAFRLSADFEDVRDEIIGSPEDLLGRVIKEALKFVKNKNIKEGLEHFLTDKKLKESMINNVVEIIPLDQKSIDSFIVRYFYDKFQGNFTIEDSEAGNQSSLSITRGSFYDAFINKDRLLRRRNEKLEIVRVTADRHKKEEDFRGIIEEIEDINKSLRFAEASQAEIKILGQSLYYALHLPDEEGKPLLGDFLKEYLVLMKFNVNLSERLQKRFANNFSMVNSNSKPEQFQTAFLNTIGEATLISMGILSPEIFALQKADLDKKLFDETKESLTKEGVDIVKLLNDYKLKGQGTIFWNRWKVLGQKLDSITDDKIREFLTLTVRQDAARVLKIFEYQQLFKSAQEINSAGGNGKNEKEEKKIKLRESLADIFKDEEVRNSWIGLIKERWLSKLNIFMASRQEKMTT